MPEIKPESELSALQALSLLGQLGLVMVAGVGLGLGGGLYLDRLLGSGHLMMVVGIVVGVGGGAAGVYRIIKQQLPK